MYEQLFLCMVKHCLSPLIGLFVLGFASSGKDDRGQPLFPYFAGARFGNPLFAADTRLSAPTLRSPPPQLVAAINSTINGVME